MKAWPGFFFALWVLVALVVAFGWRAEPTFVPTEPALEHLWILDVAQSDQVSVAVGEGGRIFRRLRGDTQWQPVASPTARSLTAVVPFAAGFVAVGHDSRILIGDAEAAQWREVYADPEAEEPLLAAHAGAGDGRIWAVGAYGRVLVSEDLGETWALLVDLDEDWHFNALASTGEVLVLAGEAGTLRATQDDGASWFSTETDYEGTFFGALALSNESILVFGMRGHVYRSDDAGESWSDRSLPGIGSLYGGSVSAGGDSVLLVGQGGLLAYSRDAGQSFTHLQTMSTRTLVGAALDENGWWGWGEAGIHRLPEVPVEGRFR
jgi:photosystem II stability/assembly factor-like uncharacterized protein